MRFTPSAMSERPPRNKASRACAACQKYKRRCDKLLPSCSLCVRLQRSCDYANRQTENELKTRIQELETLVASHVGMLSPQSSASSSHNNGVLSQTSNPLYPAALHFCRLFLEPELPNRLDSAPPPSGGIVPLAVLHHIGDQPQRVMIMSQYFQTIHKWVPIVSKIRLGSLADAELHGNPRADFALLLLAMKLIQDVPQDVSSALRDPLYISAKEFAATLEIAGVYTLLKLQANLLIALYEMGHGIFPAAYISMGNCVTQAMALGIHNKEAPQILKPPRLWTEWEERQRVWWLVVILDRYITSVGNNRPLLSADPTISSHLPVDDKAWDSGESVPPERLVLSSSPELTASPFARLAQAAHLLGEVIKHCNDESPILIDVKKEVEMLSQAILAFLEIISKETDSIAYFYSAVGVSLSALMKLFGYHSCDSFAFNERLSMADATLAREISMKCKDIGQIAIRKAISFIEILYEKMQTQDSNENYASLSPWFLDCVYQAMANLAFLATNTTAQDAAIYTSQRAMCEDILQRANNRWKVGGAYMEMIELVDEELKAGHYC